MIADDNDNAVCIKVYKHHIALPALNSTNTIASRYTTKTKFEGRRRTKKKKIPAKTFESKNRILTHTNTHTKYSRRSNSPSGGNMCEI